MDTEHRIVHPSQPGRLQSPRPLDRVRPAIRARRYSPKTEEAYVARINRYIVFHDKRHPAEMGGDEATRFLSSLALRDRVSASTQNQAPSAALFLDKDVLQRDLPWLDGVVPARRPGRFPVLLTHAEVRAVVAHRHGVPRLTGTRMYGTGLRLVECARLRVKGVDCDSKQIRVRDGQGQKDRAPLFPAMVEADLARRCEATRQHRQRDISQGAGWVGLPRALERKYPTAGREWARQWVFPATSCDRDRETDKRRRHHLHASVVQRAMKKPSVERASRSRQRPTRSGIPLLLTSLEMATISGLCRSFWGTRR